MSECRRMRHTAKKYFRRHTKPMDFKNCIPDSQFPIKGTVEFNSIFSTVDIPIESEKAPLRNRCCIKEFTITGMWKKQLFSSCSVKYCKTLKYLLGYVSNLITGNPERGSSNTTSLQLPELLIQLITMIIRVRTILFITIINDQHHHYHHQP